MIVTVTPNPSLDRTLQVDRLEVGRVNRATDELVDAGGKGVNVARALAAHGVGVRAVVPMGGDPGRQLGHLLSDQGIRVVAVPLNGRTRTNVTIVDEDGIVTKVNEAGAQLGPASVAELLERVEAALSPGDWLATCGSLPPAAPDDLHARLVEVARAAGARVAVDTSGVPLHHAVGAGPDLVKPNRHELEELIGGAATTLDEVVVAAQQLRGRGVAAVLTSLGADGAVLVDADGAWHARAVAEAVRSDVGAGDAALAGFLAAGASGPDALRQAVAWGTAAVAQPGTAMPAPDDLRPGVVELTTLTVPATTPGSTA